MAETANMQGRETASAATAGFRVLCQMSDPQPGLWHVLKPGFEIFTYCGWMLVTRLAMEVDELPAEDVCKTCRAGAERDHANADAPP